MSRPRVRRLHGDVVRRRAVQGPKIARDPNYLTIDNVARLINGASFAVAHYGTRFNVRISIRHGVFGCKTQDEAADHFALFSKGLDSRLKDWTGAGHRLGVQEVNDVEGFCGRIVAFAPDVRLLQRWAKRAEALNLPSRTQSTPCALRMLCGTNGTRGSAGASRRDDI